MQSEKEKRLMICVVIPSYNAEGFILRAVDSAFISGANCVIVVNDGSTDGTLAMLQGHARFQDELIVVSQTNKGESAAVNAGVDYICKRYSSKIESKSSPVYLCVLSADDFLHENSLEHLRCALEVDRDAVAAYPNWNLVNSAEEVLKFMSPEKYDKVSLLGKLRCLPGPGTLMRISAINGLNGPLRNENVTFIGDLDQWVRLSRLGRFLKVPVLGASWTDHELNQTKLIDGEVLSRDYRQLKTSVVEELTHWPSKEAEVLFEVTYNRIQAVILSPLGFFWLGVRHLFASLNVARRSSLPFSQTGWKLLEIAGVVTPFAAPLARGFRRLRNR